MTRAGGIRIAIVGGGIAGLATALALAARGIASVVIERREQFEEAGAGIQIGPNGMHILASLGVAERLAPHASAPAAIVVMDGRREAAPLARLPLGAWIAERHGAPYWVVHRVDLHAALLASVRAQAALIEIVTGDAPAALEPVTSPTSPTPRDAAGTAVLVRTLRGAAIRVDGVVGADGVHSWVRGIVAPGTQRPHFTGRSAARAVLDVDAVPVSLREPVTRVWLRAGAHVVHYPVRQGRELAIVVIGSDGQPSEGWDAPADRAWVEACAARFPAPLRALVATAESWRKWPLLEMAPLSRWSAGRITLAGDAAHPILPFLAQGGVLALEDAVTLAAAIAEHGAAGIPGAFATYAAARRPRALAVAQASRQNGRIYHLSGPLAMARDAVLRRTPPERLMARYDWLYGWRA